MRGSWLVAVLVAAASLALVGRASAGSTLRIDLSTDVDYTDPALSYLSTGWQLEHADCAKLVNYPDAAGAAVVQPEIASGYPTVSADGRTYTFTVRSGLRFSNGATVTPQDVAWTFNRALAPAMQSPAVAFVPDLVGLDAYSHGTASSISGISVSGNTVSFQLIQAAGDFVARLAMPFFCIVPQTVPIDPNGVTTLPSAGPYYVSGRSPNVSITLSKNPFYAGSRSAHFDQIQVQIGISQNSSESRVKAGQSDYAAGGLPPADYQSVHDAYGDGSAAAAGGRQQFFVNQQLNFSYLALNTSRPHFNDARLRRAVSYALDRPALLSQGGAYAGTVTDQILMPGMPGYVDQAFYPLAGPDLTTARSLAAQAGVSQASPITADLYTSNGGSAPARAQLIHDELAQIGINVVVHAFPRAEQITREGTRGEPFDMATEGWIADYVDPYDLINVLLNGETIQANNNNNVSYFNDATFNARMDAAVPLSGQPRYDAYTSIERDILQQAAPIVPLSTVNSRDFFSSRVGCHLYVSAYGMDLTQLCQRAPEVTARAPVSGAVGTTVTLTGRNFSDATGVSLCFVPTTFTVVSDTQVTASVPAGACDGRWRVSTDGGTGASDDAFTVVSVVPTISGFSPSVGNVGSNVTLTGARFTGATGVTLCFVATTFTVDSDSQITASVPSGACDGRWRVTTAAGTGASDNAFTVTYPPTIASFAPASGDWGSTVTISGGHFASVTNVSLCFVDAAYVVDGPGQITAQVPFGACSGRWRVTNSLGTAASDNALTVTVSQPTITSMSTTTGPVGSTVVIHGTNLGAITNASLCFYGTELSVDSPTQVTVTVPDGACDGYWRVSNSAGTAVAGGPFTVTGPVVSGFTPAGGPVGSTVTLSGRNFSAATQVSLCFVTASFAVTSSTTISVQVPAGACNGRWRVTTPAGTAASLGAFSVG
jgi:ABC-type transport system substrate-binding protein